MFESKGLTGLFVATTGLAVLVCVPATAQAPPAPVARFLAETANLSTGPASVRIDILNWSTDAERSRLVDGWNGILPAAGGGRGAGGARGGGAPTGGAGGRGGRGEAAPPQDPAGEPSPAQARGRGAAGGRGAGGRGAAGGRDGGPGGAITPPAAAPDTPAGAVAAILQAAPGVGYLWSSESVGYSLRYAHRITEPDGRVRIVLATDRRLGGLDDSWRPAAGVPNDYPFSLIELRLNAALEGEGKASLIGRVTVDAPAAAIALEEYAALPVVLRQVRPGTN